MKLHLWHFTRRAEDARKIQDEGFMDHSTGALGVRWPCLALAGERNWEVERGPALVEVWIDIDEQSLSDYFTRYGSDGRRDIIFYQIVPDLLNAPGVRRLAHDNADHLPRTPGYDSECP
jgi:hypothetical protein